MEEMTEIGAVALALQPLIFLPGVALLVSSTSQRFARLHNEVHLHANDPMHAHPPEHLLARGRLLQLALSLLYAAVACLAMGGLWGGVATLLPWVGWVALALSGAAILAVVIASALLFLESSQSLQVIRDEVEAHRRASPHDHGHGHGS